MPPAAQGARAGSRGREGGPTAGDREAGGAAGDPRRRPGKDGTPSGAGGDGQGGAAQRAARSPRRPTRGAGRATPAGTRAAPGPERRPPTGDPAAAGRAERDGAGRGGPGKGGPLPAAGGGNPRQSPGRDGTIFVLAAVPGQARPVRPALCRASGPAPQPWQLLRRSMPAACAGVGAAGQQPGEDFIPLRLSAPFQRGPGSHSESRAYLIYGQYFVMLSASEVLACGAKVSLNFITMLFRSLILMVPLGF